MRSVRVWFTKTGDMKYISHLDINRYMTRALRRADIPLWYTEGFNTHPYITFALPLSLGIESDCESMDIRIEGEISNAEIKEKLGSVMTQEIEIIDVTEPVMKSNDIALAEYDIIFETENDAGRYIDRMKKVLDSGEIIVEKLGKSGHKKVLKQVNIAEHIKKYDLEKQGDDIKMTVTLPAGNTLNVNPSLLSEYLINNLEADDIFVRITRKKLMNSSEEIFR